MGGKSEEIIDCELVDPEKRYKNAGIRPVR